jgi:para-nitrobenzyl esterase
MTIVLNRRALLMGGAAVMGLAACASGPPPGSPESMVVSSQHGKLHGVYEDGVYEFRGVRYAQPPTGANRFQAPKPLVAWTGEQSAQAYGQAAVQMRAGAGAAAYPPLVQAAMTEAYKAPDGNKPEGDEDCLVLNVYSQRVGPSAGAKRPVMVWIHGGGFSYGQAGLNIYRGHNLAKKHDVVFVGVNHRLNVFGYLGLDAAGVPGFQSSSNAGMLDLVAALEWVRDNIAMFGGDPSNVTIFGQSGGGAKVSTLLAMPRAAGLFHKAVIQSGAGLRAAEKEEAAATARDFLSRLNIPPGEAAQKLATASTADILAAATQLGANRFRPVLDGAALPRHPFDPGAPEQSANIPVMIGFTKDEQTLYNVGNPRWADTTEAQVLEAAERVGRGKGQVIVDAFKRQFPDYGPKHLLMQVTGTVNSLRSHHTLASRKAAQPAPVYAYVFAHDLPPQDFVLKAPHTSEIPYIMANVENAPLFAGATASDVEMGRLMSSVWVSFATSGNPATRGLPAWPKFNPQTRPTMFFSSESKVVQNPYAEVWQVIQDNPVRNASPI